MAIRSTLSRRSRVATPLAGAALTLTMLSGAWLGCRSAPRGDAGVPTSGDGEFLFYALASSEAGPTVFPHGLHSRLVGTDGERIHCLRCHHSVDEDEDALPWRCIDCHPGEKTDPRFHDLPT